MPWSDPLLAAAQYKSCKTVGNLLKTGCNPNRTDIELITPLEIACQNNDLPTVKVLLTNGAAVNIQNRYGETALHLASYEDVSYKIFDAILKSKAEVSCEDNDQKTPLHIVCDEFNKARAILQLPQPPVNARDIDGATPMHLLVNAQAGKDDIMKLLKYAIQKGFDVNAQTDAGETILHVGSQQVNSEELLSAMLHLESIEPSLQDKTGDNFLHSFLRYRRLAETSEEFLCKLLDGKFSALANDGVSRLVNQQNDIGFLPLSSYIFQNIVNIVVIRKFVKYIENEDTQEIFGHSLLHLTLESARTTNEKIQMVKCLLHRNASVNIKDQFGRTPLYYARSLSVVKLLIDNGANVQCTDQCKRTPLIALLRTCNPNICQYLINKGSMVESTDKFGSNALHYAAWKNRVKEIEILIKSDIDIFRKDRTGRTPYEIATFWRCKEAADMLKEAMKNTKRRSLKRKLSHPKEGEDDTDVLWTPCNRSIVHSDYQTIKNMQSHFGLPEDLEGYIDKVANLPGVGITHVVEESVWVEETVVSLAKAIALQIGELDSRFRCKVFRSGAHSKIPKSRTQTNLIFSLY